jgi:creatinine amidohydrolase
MHLREATWPEADAQEGRVALLPVGSTEQHGPHAALATDARAAEAVAARGATAADADVVVAPTLPVGISEEHRAFAGTLWVSPETFRATVRDVVGSLAHHGWDRVVVVNGHGGNAAALREVCGALSRAGEGYAVPFTWFDAVDEEVGHAGAVETSVLMAVEAGLVRPNERATAASEGADRWGEWIGAVNLAYDADEFSENGVVGDPTAASAERGEALLTTAGAALGELVDTVAERDIGDAGED